VYTSHNFRGESGNFGGRGEGGISPKSSRIITVTNSNDDLPTV